MKKLFKGTAILMTGVAALSLSACATHTAPKDNLAQITNATSVTKLRTLTPVERSLISNPKKIEARLNIRVYLDGDFMGYADDRTIWKLIRAGAIELCCP